MALYGYGKRRCLWFNFESHAEAERWEQAIKQVITTRDGASAWAGRRGLQETGAPAWHQMVAQGEHFFTILQEMEEYQWMATAASEVRKQEQFGGFLSYMRHQTPTFRTDAQALVPWKKVYRALQNNLFVMYESAT